MNRQWQLCRPKRWFNATLFYLGWLGLCWHFVLMLFCWWQQIHYPVSWWFTVLAPALSICWGGMPLLQLQRERYDWRPAHMKCE